MKLYYNPGLCSLAPHILFREAGLNVALVKVDMTAKRTENGADYLGINPHGYVPALEIEPGVVLTEGPAIMQYLADLAPESRLAPAGGLARYQFQSWLNFITSEIHKTYSALFKSIPAEAKTVFKDALAVRLEHVDRHLAQQDYLLDSGYSAADAYLYVTTSWSPFVGISLDKWPALKAFRARIEARPAVQAALRAEGLLKLAA
jgi:glutathione S-transferase